MQEDQGNKVELERFVKTVKEARIEVDLYGKAIEKIKDDARGEAARLNEGIIKLEEKMQVTITKIERNVEVLDAIVSKLDQRIEGIVPNIVVGLDKLQQKHLEEIRSSAIETNRELKQAAEEVMERAAGIKARRIRSYLIGLCISIVLASVIASGGAYVMIKSFPSMVRFNIDKSANIAIKDSEVTIWDRGGIKNTSEKGSGNGEVNKSESSKVGQRR